MLAPHRRHGVTVLEHPLQLGIERVLGRLHVREEQVIEEGGHLVDPRLELGDGGYADHIADSGHGVQVPHQAVVVFERDLGKARSHVTAPCGLVDVVGVDVSATHAPFVIWSAGRPASARKNRATGR